MTHIYSTGRKKTVAKAALQVIVIAAVLFLFIYGFSNTSSSADAEKQVMTERAIRNALISCYAIEGMYPQNLSYLEENYGLVIDHQRFVIFYDIFGSNIYPSVRVVPVGGSTDTGE